jgi:hypothetical protein
VHVLVGDSRHTGTTQAHIQLQLCEHTSELLARDHTSPGLVKVLWCMTRAVGWMGDTAYIYCVSCAHNNHAGFTRSRVFSVHAVTSSCICIPPQIEAGGGRVVCVCVHMYEENG